MNTSIVTKKYQLFSIVILFGLISVLGVITIVNTIPSVSALLTTSSYLEQVQANYDSNYNQRNLWSLGNNIQEGDYYSYKICNDDYITQIIYPYHCYQINLEFVKILTSYKGKVWVVQGNFTILDTTLGTTLDTILDNTPNTSQPMIFLIDSTTFDVTTDPFNVDLGNSIQNTLFSLSTHGVQSLSIGTIWGEIDSYFTNTIPFEIKNKQTIPVSHTSVVTNVVTSVNGTVDTSIVNSIVTEVVTSIVTNLETSVLSYDIIIPSNIYLHESFPFPLKAVMYSPHIIYPHPKELYYFELLDYSNEYSNYYSRDYGFNDSVSIIGELEIK